MKLRLLALVGMLALFSLSVWSLLTLDWGERLSTDVMELIPDQQASPELAMSRGVLSDVYSNRVLVAMQSVADARSVDAYVSHLEASPLVAQVIDMSAGDTYEILAQFVFEHRFELLLSEWLASSRTDASNSEKFAEIAVERLDLALDDPSFAAFEEIIPSDPLFLMQSAMETFQQVQPTNVSSVQTHLLEVTLAVSALKPEGQIPVFELLDEAASRAKVFSPELRVLDTGAHRYAFETEHNMRQEVQTLNVSTFVVVFLICSLLCRRVILVFHVFGILLLSLVCGLALLFYFFGQVHVFALIFGCVLCGVVLDYGLHAYLHDAGKSRRSFRTFVKPFFISCGSTLVGFSILLFSELPVLRQMGALVVCGLVMAVVITLAYVFAVLPASASVKVFAGVTRPSRLGAWLVAAVGICTVLALPFTEWEDDIRSLKYPLPKLDAVDAEIRVLQGGERAVLISVGSDFASSREHAQRLADWLSLEAGADVDLLTAARVVPTLADYEHAREFVVAHPNFGMAVQSALARAGYEGEAFEPFVEDWQRAVGQDWGDGTAYEALVGAFSDALDGSLSGMIGSNEGHYWWVSLVDADVLPASLPSELHSFRLSQVESMSSVLGRYRQRTLELSLIAGALMYVVLLFSFGLKDGTRIFVVPMVGVASAVTAIYFVFGSLGIFHLIGLFLGACLVLDYAVFTWIGVRRCGEMPFSVVVSALTTMASFFILCWSQIPAIHSLGLAVFSVTVTGALCSYLWVPAMIQKEGVVDAS